MASFDRLVFNAQTPKANAAFNRALAKPSLKREASSSEQKLIEIGRRPVGFYKLHCIHDRPRFEICQNCHRTRKEADAFLAKLLSL
jgi:hypothetical protein